MLRSDIKLTGKNSEAAYVGRFAPSPTGPLHFGSLLAAIASFLDARANQGSWLVRIEDLDPPREPAGTAELILQQLVDLGLNWDGEVLYQSDRLADYKIVLATLQQAGLCYHCDCTRSQIKAMGNVYNGRCRNRTSPPKQEFALRLRVDSSDSSFDDLVQGNYKQNLLEEVGDFVIRRKDKLFAYQLAVVADDELQKITHIVRGVDLIDSTPRQIYLQKNLGYNKPLYGHIPIVVDEFGKKLSKQAFAPSIDTKHASKLIYQALTLLGQSPASAMETDYPAHQLQWAIENWDIQNVPKLTSLSLSL